MPEVPEIELVLLADTAPARNLDGATAQRVMDNPLYWIFCWASGQVLARYLLDQPETVAGKRVMDFGCGSGVVGIAAALAGAGEVVACDDDPLALEATAVNAAMNGVPLTLAGDFYAVEGPMDLIVMADVLYDRSNLPWLDRAVDRAPEVLLADSRLRDFSHDAYAPVGTYQSNTIPDLDESKEFRNVSLYKSPRQV
ncbi:MAG: 50S ribosomal protein L11 methyltransferase [Pseudomonadota bacterium]